MVEECNDPDDYWLRCAVVAGNLGDLRDRGTPGVLREYRLTNHSGPPHAPIEMVIVREFRDSVRGQLLLLWPGDMKGGTFLAGSCERTWSNAAAVLCEAFVTRTPNWGDVLQQVDAAGIRDIPAHPFVPTPCETTMVPSPTGGPPLQRFCPRTFDGPSFDLEARHGPAFWSYPFPESGQEHPGAEWRRDAAVLKVFREVIRLRGER